jgi:CubicO group peptidase (beta-lactamase class C family)
MRFAEMLRAQGSFKGNQILSPKTIKFMTKDHLPKNTTVSGSGENPLSQAFRGFGFGLGFGVITDIVETQAPGSEGSYMWGGAAGTIFWVDPEEDLVALCMIQLMGSPWPLREELRILTYQALTESLEE